MKRRCYVILLLGIFFLHYGQQSLLLIWYHLEPTSFTAAFCVNKDMPTAKLACHGKCQLEKMAQQTPVHPAEGQEDVSILLGSDFRAVLTAKTLALLQVCCYKKGAIASLPAAYGFEYIPYIFHPPVA